MRRNSISTITTAIILTFACGAIAETGMIEPDQEQSVAASGCCVGRVGDANGSGGDEPTIGDAMEISLWLFGPREEPACIDEADINQSGGLSPTADDVTIGDVARLLDYLFITGPSLGLNAC